MIKSMATTIRVLVLYARYNIKASYYDDWLDAFLSFPRFETIEINICSADAVSKLKAHISEVDFVVLLHSVNADHVFYLEPLVPYLSDRKIGLLSFIGNEVNLPGVPITDKRKVLASIQPNYIATQLLQEAGEYLWGDIAPVIAIPHALNHHAFDIIPPTVRSIDLGVRFFRYHPHLGDNDRNQMMGYFVSQSFHFGLNVDICEQRLNREKWISLLGKSKGTLSTEAGSWFIQQDDAIVREIQEYISDQAGNKWIISASNIRLRKLVHKMPQWLRTMAQSIASSGLVRYESNLASDVQEEYIISRFFSNRNPAPVYSKCISSRHFEAIGTRTVQILLEGRYNDILEPGIHYFSLSRDYSNVEELIDEFKDPVQRQSMTDAAYDHLRDSHTFEHRLKLIINCMDKS